MKTVKSPGINMVNDFIDTFKIQADKDTFVMTVSKLWIKEYAAA